MTVTIEERQRRRDALKYLIGQWRTLSPAKLKRLLETEFKIYKVSKDTITTDLLAIDGKSYLHTKTLKTPTEVNMLIEEVSNPMGIFTTDLIHRMEQRIIQIRNGQIIKDENGIERDRIIVLSMYVDLCDETIRNTYDEIAKLNEKIVELTKLRTGYLDRLDKIERNDINGEK